MDTLKGLKPPGFINPTGLDELVIVIRILIEEETLELADLFPARNRIGTEMLSRLLGARIEAAGVRVTHSVYLFEFNRSFYTFNVSELPGALAAVKAELGQLRLLEVAQVAWNDPREGVLRMEHPKASEFLWPQQREREAEFESITALVEAVHKSLNRAQRPKDDN